MGDLPDGNIQSAALVTPADREFSAGSMATTRVWADANDSGPLVGMDDVACALEAFADSFPGVGGHGSQSRETVLDPPAADVRTSRDTEEVLTMNCTQD